MKFVVVFLILVSAFSNASAQSSLVSMDQFYPGAYWVWSYAERDEESQKWQDPYLYERYQVIAVDGDQVTIEMSSGSEVDHENEPHHKFVADVSRCLELGASKMKFQRFRIEFYTKSFGNGWSLLSKKHKGLAFTEKFNCFSDKVKQKTDQISFFSELVDVFQWRTLAPRSWYARSMDATLQGVMMKRGTKNIAIKLIDINSQQN